VGTIFAKVRSTLAKRGFAPVAGLGLFFRRMDLPACQKLQRSENCAGTHKKTQPLAAFGRGRFLNRTPGPPPFWEMN